MKTVRKILNFIFAIVILLCLGLILCAVNPTVGGKVQTFFDYIGLAEKLNNSEGPVFEKPDIQFYPLYSPEVERIPITVPSNVSNKSDLQNVEAVNESIEDSDAKHLADTLGVGDTGESLEFSKNYYPYYHMLSVSEKEIYSQIYANAKALKSDFVPVTSVNKDELYDVFEAVCNDHPELFWMDTAYQCKYTGNGDVVEINLSFNKTAEDLASSQRLFNTVCEQIIASASGLTSVYEKEKAIHDSIAARCEYDSRADLGQSAYSALVNGRTVCAGYSRAFQYLCHRLDIPCYYVTGYADEDHAWNIIRISDGFRNVDVTWDDDDVPNYDYFNRTDADLAGTHVRTGLSVNLPACVESGTGVDILPSTQDLINTNPTKPLIYETPKPEVTAAPVLNAEELEELKRKEFIEVNSLKDEDVVKNLEDYYKRCYERIVALGKGQKQYTLYIPEKIWDSVQNAYATEAYQTGYATSALENIKASEFAIQIQMSNMPGGYIKVVHNINSR